jgi:tetratricopeptide (TPR) repeat protein
MWGHLIAGRLAEAAAIAEKYLSRSLVRPIIHPSFAAATAGPDAAIDLLRQTFAAHPSQATTRLLVVGLVESTRLDEARDLLFDDRAQPVDEVTARLVHLAFVEEGRWEEATELGRRLLDARSDQLIAYNTACSCARSNRHDEALRWLEKAIDAGFSDAAQIDSDPDLEPLRLKADYVRIRDKLEIQA